MSDSAPAQDVGAEPSKLSPESPEQPEHTGFRFLDRMLTSKVIDFFVATRRGTKIALGSDKRPYVEQISREISAEQGLVAARMTWNLTFQGFLFAAYALAVSRTPESSGALIAPLLETLPWAGIAIAALTFLGIIAAFWQINNLKRCWYGNESELKVIAPRPFSPVLVGLLGRLPPWESRSL